MNPALGLAAARIVIGGCAFATPDLGTKLFRLDGPGNPQLPYMTRLFGSREIVLGAATLLASGKTRRNLVLADAAAAWLAGEARAVDRTTAAMLTAPAVAAVCAGVAGVAAG
jgi:hypothetical protein